MQDRIVITDATAAAVFAAVSQRRIIEPLMNEPLSLAALARVTHKPLSLLHYHVQKWLRLGLVEVVDEKRRAGRPIKRYQAAARSFFVPADYVHALPGAGLGILLRDALDRHQVKSLQGVEFTHDDQGPRMIVHREPRHASAVIERWLDIGLSSDDADQLFGDLCRLVDTYRSRESVAEPRYLVYLAAARL